MSVTTPHTDMELVHGIRAGDEQMREQLIMRHMPLVRSIAHRYAGRGLAFDDIVQAGSLGLVQSVNRYQPERGVPLSAFAARTIEGEIMHQFRDRGWSVRVPRSLQELSRRTAKVNERLSHRLGRAPTTDELAKAMEVTPEQVEEAIMAQRAYTAESLDISPGDDGASDGGRGQRWLATTDEMLESVPDRATLVSVMRTLPSRERRIVALRYFDDLTQSEIAERLGISQMHVSRLLRSALDALRRELEPLAA
jgi:RNA polymerase sigma-B factor